VLIMPNNMDHAEAINEIINRACDEAIDRGLGNEYDLQAALIQVFCDRVQKEGQDPTEALEIYWPDLPTN